MKIAEYLQSKLDRQRLHAIAGGVAFCRKSNVQPKRSLSARAADADPLNGTAGATDTDTCADDQIELFNRKLAWRYFNLTLGDLLDLYRLHVSHLRKITDQFVRNKVSQIVGGGMSRNFIFFSLSPSFARPI
jgi:hypothetical protein